MVKKMAREEKLERYGSSSSWADEVEREEREEAQKQSIRLFESKTRSRKPNPFGAARPREVVLEEKGVDWRKLDQDLDHTHSNLRKYKKPKENIRLSPAPIIRRGSELKKPYLAEDTSPLVPPIMYAPKNIMALMEQIRRGRKDLMYCAAPPPVENSCGLRARAHHIMNEEPIIYSDSRYERNCSGERYHPQYDNYGADMVIKIRRELAPPTSNCNNEYRICDAAGCRVMERTNPCTMHDDEGVDSRNAAVSTKRRLAVVQPGPCPRRTRSKQCR